MIYISAPYPDVNQPKKYMRLLESWTAKVDVPVAYVHGALRVFSIEA